MSQKGNSNLKFARYPLEKSSMLTSLELKSKLQERLAEPHCASCESGGQHSLRERRLLPTMGWGWGGRRGMKNHKSPAPWQSLHWNCDVLKQTRQTQAGTGKEDEISWCNWWSLGPGLRPVDTCAPTNYGSVQQTISDEAMCTYKCGPGRALGSF